VLAILAIFACMPIIMLSVAIYDNYCISPQEVEHREIFALIYTEDCAGDIRRIVSTLRPGRDYMLTWRYGWDAERYRREIGDIRVIAEIDYYANISAYYAQKDGEK